MSLYQARDVVCLTFSVIIKFLLSFVELMVVLLPVRQRAIGENALSNVLIPNMIDVSSTSMELRLLRSNEFGK